MNTIGNEKLTLSLDDIIAREPQRYSAPGTRPVVESQSPQVFRPKIVGRMQHEPYKQALMRKTDNHAAQQHWKGSTAIPSLRPSPYDHNSFKYNGVHVSENSALLNRRVGEVEITCRPQADEYDIVEEEEEDEDNEVAEEAEINDVKAIGVPVPIKNNRTSPLLNARLYTDLNYVRLPVHQRLGWSAADQFRKSRVDNAAKFLRTRQNKPQNMFGQTQQIMREKLKSLGDQSRSNNGMQVSFVNELALNQSAVRKQPQPLMEIKTMPPPGMPPLLKGNKNDDGVFVAPLSRQNVARLPGGRFTSNSGASSRMSSLTNEEQILERISSIENQVNKIANIANNSSSMSMASSFLPMNATAMISQGAMMNQGAVMLPVVGGGMQAYVPLVTPPPSTSSQESYTAFQGHIVQPQEGGGLIIQAVGNLGSPETTNGRIRRQLIMAGNKQPLEQDIQSIISTVQAALRCNNHDRPSQEAFTFRPEPHTTLCTINKRIQHYRKPANANRGRRAKHNKL